MKNHYTEADLLETYYTQPGESMPVMMHLASCQECSARYDRLDHKLREAASCSTEKPDTFWLRQRRSVTRQIEERQAAWASFGRVTRVAAAAVIAFFLGGITVYKSVVPASDAPTTLSIAHVNVGAPAVARVSDDLQVSKDPWQSDELQDFHGVVQWESWVADSKTKQGGSSL